jgi:hypothetical protein
MRSRYAPIFAIGTRDAAAIVMSRWLRTWTASPTCND